MRIVKLNNELARHVAVTAFRSSATLNELIPLLKHHCDENEYQEYLEAISAISMDVALKLLKKIYEKHPEIEIDIDQKIETYGYLISG